MIFAVIMAYIWDLRFTHPGGEPGDSGNDVVSTGHREGAGRLGFSRAHLKECCEKFAPAVVLLALCCWGPGS